MLVFSTRDPWAVTRKTFASPSNMWLCWSAQLRPGPGEWAYVRMCEGCAGLPAQQG